MGTVFQITSPTNRHSYDGISVSIPMSPEICRLSFDFEPSNLLDNSLSSPKLLNSKLHHQEWEWHSTEVTQHTSALLILFAASLAHFRLPYPIHRSLSSSTFCRPPDSLSFCHGADVIFTLVNMDRKHNRCSKNLHGVRKKDLARNLTRSNAMFDHRNWT